MLTTVDKIKRLKRLEKEMIKTSSTDFEDIYISQHMEDCTLCASHSYHEYCDVYVPSLFHDIPEIKSQIEANPDNPKLVISETKTRILGQFIIDIMASFCYDIIEKNKNKEDEKC